MKKTYYETYGIGGEVVNFDLDYDGLCESINCFEVDDMDTLAMLYRGVEGPLVNEITFQDIDDFVSILKQKVQGFVVSPHRTTIEVSWMDDAMDIVIVYYNSPDWNDYETINLEQLEKIPLRWGQTKEQKIELLEKQLEEVLKAYNILEEYTSELVDDLENRRAIARRSSSRARKIITHCNNLIQSALNTEIHNNETHG